MGSGLVGFHVKVMLPGGPFAVSENWLLPQEGPSLPSLGGPHGVKMSQNTKKHH